MIDIHVHILSETDDGATNFSESVALLFEAKKAGFTGLVCTPHYMKNLYDNDAAYIYERIKELEIDAKRIGINLYQGNEISATEDICDLIEQSKVTRINNSRYLLIEFPMIEKPIKNSMEIIDNIVNKGYVPIIAHPERYPYVQKDIKYAKELINRGALLQANFASIDGYYGGATKKTIIKLLKNKMIHFLGTDTHRKKTIYTNMDKYVDMYMKYLSENEFDELTYKNPIRVINDAKIRIENKGTKRFKKN